MSKRYLGLICLLYSGIMGYVIVFNKLKNFLAPQMQIYIKLSIIPLIIIGLVLLFNSTVQYEFMLKDLVLITPLIFLIFAGDGRLTASLASNRTITSNKDEKYVAESKAEFSTIENKNELPSKKLDNIYFDVVDETFAYLAVYLSFADKAVTQDNVSIRVKGFVTKDSNINPRGYFSLGRYEISCCAADASFLGFLIKDDNYNIKENGWYEIEGTLKVMPKNSQKYILYIEPSYMKEIDKSREEQYVYPCYSYGDGSCGKAQDYDLEY